MSALFEQTTINSMTLKNRFVRSATWEGMATDEGSCTTQLIDLMTQLADGGVGLIISGHAYVSREGQAGPKQMGIYEDRLTPRLDPNGVGGPRPKRPRSSFNWLTPAVRPPPACQACRPWAPHSVKGKRSQFAGK